MKEQTPSLWGLPHDTLKTLLIEQGLSSFGADQIYHWAFKRDVFEKESWQNVSQGIKKYLAEGWDFFVPRIVWHKESGDGTRKFLIAMKDGLTVETVAIPGKNRLTLCLSSQVGCALGCRFCHTGKMGLKRHLQAGEIVGQFMAVSKWLGDKGEPGPSNIVYMGQGEPLHNFEQVKWATEVFREVRGYGLSQRKITLSTSGLVPQIEKLWDFPPVNIAISLHAAHNNIRSELMPINKVYDLERLFKAIKKIPLKAHRRITYEYLLIKDLNDRREDLQGLAGLIPRKESKINLIPFNEYPESSFQRPSPDKIAWFQEELIKRGYICTVRTTKGDDILAACGQLNSQLAHLGKIQAP